MVPQGGDVTIANGQIQGLRNLSGQCACEAFESKIISPIGNGPEISTLASSEEIRKSADAQKSPSSAATTTPAPETPKASAVGPTYQVFMPPLRYDANAKIQDDFDPKLIVLIRRVRVRPTLIFESRVEGDPIPRPVNKPALVASKPETPPPNPNAVAKATVVERVKSFFKSLWTPSS